MPLLSDGRLVADPWLTVPDGAPLPDGPAIVSLARWRAERAALTARNAALGLRLAAGEPVEEIAPDLARFAVVALDFPSFRDGRSYSAARLLRERYGYAGELRAIGNVLRDQLAGAITRKNVSYHPEAPSTTSCVTR